MDLVLLDKQDRVGTLTLNRPEKLNAMNPTLLGEFSEAIASVGADEEIKVLIIRGAGRAFSAGYDLAAGGGGKTVDADRTELQKMIERWLSLRELPKPVIAMVHGYCLAGASQICACSDVIFMADNARLGFPSLPAGAGFVSSMWNWLVGPHRTKYMAFLPGSQISGKEAEAMGFATRTFPAETLMDLQGFRTAVLSGAEYDAIFHFGSGNDEILRVRKERGLRGAIQWYEEQ